MSHAEWSKVICDMYVACREGKGWPDIFDCFEKEDQDYIWFLEDLKDEGKLKTKKVNGMSNGL